MRVDDATPAEQPAGQRGGARALGRDGGRAIRGWAPLQAGGDGPLAAAGGSPRTDLAVEAVQRPRRVDGVDVEEGREGEVSVTRVRVRSDEAERVVGKPRGTYVTLDAPGLLRRDTAVQEQVARVLARELGALLPLDAESHIFVVGLGNWNATPDALGPRVVSEVLVTRHLAGQVPDDLSGQVRRVSALAPGVLGLTGIETGEIIRGIVARIQPDAVVVVDALASRSVERLGRTIQVADSGIQPGSGVGNHRSGIDAQSIGVPVVAVGVPTVVHAATIAADTIDLLAAELDGQPAYAGLHLLHGEEKRQLIARVLAPAVGDLMVTPKEIDLLLEDLSGVVAAGINAALHPKIAARESLL